jgi:hypothetical protein
MCGGDWDKVASSLSKVPSRALSLYSRNCFPKRLGERFSEWQKEVLAGKQKANTSQVDPYEVVSRIFDMLQAGQKSADLDTLEAFYQLQTTELRRKGTLNAISVVDVSGSMTGTPMNVAIAMGIWTAAVASPQFQDLSITFSANPTFIDMRECGSLYERVSLMKEAEWGMNTNLQAVFDLILDKAMTASLPQDELPARLFIISDMQFDQACPGVTNFDRMRAKYQEHGYSLPEVVFWNVNGQTGDSPVTAHESGVALVSGWSKDILNMFLDGERIPSPYDMMRKAIDNPRYSTIRLADTC